MQATQNIVGLPAGVQIVNVRPGAPPTQQQAQQKTVAAVSPRVVIGSQQIVSSRPPNTNAVRTFPIFTVFFSFMFLFCFLSSFSFVFVYLFVFILFIVSCRLHVFFCVLFRFHSSLSTITALIN